MKIFWSVVAVLTVAFGALLVIGGGKEDLAADGSETTQQPVAATTATTSSPGMSLPERPKDVASATEGAETASDVDRQVQRAETAIAAEVHDKEAVVSPQLASAETAINESAERTLDAVNGMISSAANVAEDMLAATIPNPTNKPEAKPQYGAIAGNVPVAPTVAPTESPAVATLQPAESLDQLLGTESSEAVVAISTEHALHGDEDYTGETERVTADRAAATANVMPNDAASPANSSPADAGLTTAVSPITASEATPSNSDATSNVRTTTLGSQHTVVGAGTAEDPFIIPWTVLRSAAVTYRPERGMTDLPRWSEELNGKHVVVTGYTMAPVVAAQTKELMIMQNQWDGCCLGVPPTPYDAIEVRMKTPIPMSRMASLAYGTLHGVIKVDPYLHNQWLLGLYVLDDAEIVVTP